MAGQAGKRARVSLRINPDVDAKTHPYISTGLKGNKFGIAFEDVLPTYRAAAALPNIEITGIDCHIGSQITEVAPYLEALDKVLDVVEALEREGIVLEHIASAADWASPTTTKRRRTSPALPPRCSTAWPRAATATARCCSSRVDRSSAMPACC